MASFRERLINGEHLFGTFVMELRNPTLAHLLARAGFDFILLDNEHGAYNWETIQDILAAAHGAGIPVLVRIPEISREHVLKSLDCGAAGLLVPMVESVEQARELVSLAKYPPLGARGVAVRKLANLYAPADPVNYLPQANRDTFIAVQAETGLGVERVEQIAAVEGVDGVFVGPLDLSVSLGIPGQWDHPKLKEAIGRVFAGCRRQGKAVGIWSFAPDQAQAWVRAGAQFLAYGTDLGFMADGAGAALAEMKQGL